MFSGCVGLADGVAAGWANMGAGMARLLMPQIYTLLTSLNLPISTAWRLSFLVPAIFQLVTAIMVWCESSSCRYNCCKFWVGELFLEANGRVLSDKLARRYGIRGRLWGLSAVGGADSSGLLCVLLGRTNSLWGAVAMMCAFSVFVQAASGLTFGVVPFVSKSKHLFSLLYLWWLHNTPRTQKPTGNTIDKSKAAILIINVL
ncbi:hypothetical protein Tsubulata_030767 [Turnera subulata]|uniref:Uncharacterized protein n=1 Tax=Turnera subulata TaxID=218843 RepID=A0A9Q0J5G2_9ROSI|nr:hypothetical protein Tsubulata_030767 [Turnera subulata]